MLNPNRWKYRPIMSLFYKEIGCSGNKIPADRELFGDFFLRTSYSNPEEGFWCRLQVLPGKKIPNPRIGGKPFLKSSKHRIYAVCPSCQTKVPLGRLHQHIDTKRCKALLALRTDHAAAAAEAACV